MSTAPFWRGAGVGIAVGAAVGMLAMSRQGAMKTGVGRAVAKVGNAMDAAVYDIRQAMQ